MTHSPRSALGLLTFPAMLTGTLAFQAWIGPQLGFRDVRLVTFSILFGLLFGALFPATLRRIHEGVRRCRRERARRRSSTGTTYPHHQNRTEEVPASQRSTILIPLDTTTAAHLLPQDSID